MVACTLILILAVIGVHCDTHDLKNSEGTRQKRLLFYDEEGNLVKTYKDPYIQDLALHVDKYPYYGNYLNPFFTFIRASYGGALAAFAIPVSSEVIEQIQNDPVYQHKLVLTPKKDPVIAPNGLCEGKRTQVPTKNCNNFLNCWDGWAFEQECPEGLMFSREGYCDYKENVDCSNRDILCKPEGSKPGLSPAQPPQPPQPQPQPNPPAQLHPQPQPPTQQQQQPPLQQQPQLPSQQPQLPSQQPQIPTYPQPQPPMQQQPQPQLPAYPPPQLPLLPLPQLPLYPQPQPILQPQPQQPLKPQPKPPSQQQPPLQPAAPSPVQGQQPQPCPQPQIPSQTQPQVPIPQQPQVPVPQQPQIHPMPVCKEDFESFINQYNCNEFFVCVHRQPVKFQCPADLQYSEYLGVCDIPERVDCPSSASQSKPEPTLSNPAITSKPAYALPPIFFNYQNEMSDSRNIAMSRQDAVRQLQGI